MCIICVELEKDRLSSLEAMRNFGELKSNIDKDHKEEVLKKISEKAINELVAESERLGLYEEF